MTRRDPCARTVRLRFLSESQLEILLNASLEVLERTGSRVHHDRARETLARAGAHVDGDIVRLPSALVREALATVPERIAVGDRNGQDRMILETDRSYFGTGSDCPFIYDLDTGEHRKFTSRDVADAARIADACQNLDFHMSLGLTSDAPWETYDVHQAAAMLRNTIKPLTLTALSVQSLADITEMYYAVRGGREAFEANPGFILYDEPTTPLTHGKAALDKLIFAAERRIPAIYTPCPICGATAPATLAGAIVLGVAEFLLGATVAQLTRKGAALIMGGVASVMDMHTTVLSYGAPELHILSGAYADMAHFLKIPVFGTCGCSDSKAMDEQAAVETAVSTLMATLSGANLIHDIGFLEGALIGSHEMVVLTDEIAGMARHIVRGMRVDEETLALDLIHEVGPGGNFLMSQHTLDNFRREFFFPILADRTKRSDWVRDGSPTLGKRLHERVREILATHKTAPLEPKAEAAIAGVLARSDSTRREKHHELV
ncbi:MAG: trimethylamine methyltransferase family protein [Planctomycetota bacterium]